MDKHELYEDVIAMWREPVENGDMTLEDYIEWLERKLYTANTIRNDMIERFAERLKNEYI